MKNLVFLFALLVSYSVIGQGKLQTETFNMTAYKANQAVQLLDAIPDDKFSWTPQDGVRSFASVYAHIISANYFFGSKLGATPPAELNFQTLEQDIKTKEDVKKYLQPSFDAALEAMKNTPDETLNDPVEYPFPGEYTKTTTILLILSHANEHLGQLIAYSRMNEITPPWSAP